MKTASAPLNLHEETRRRLLEAAGEIFAAEGYRGATVRGICERARANVAAVNYHFGDKEALYRTVLRHAHRSSLERHPPDRGLTPDAPPARRLEGFIASFLNRIFDPEQPAWQGKLLARELFEPTGALNHLVEDIRPRAAMLRSIIEALMGPGAREGDVRLASISVVGQCLLYFHSRAVIERLYPEQTFGPAEVQKIAAHITRFSLLALAGWRGGRKKRRRKTS
ncbi:MAG: CerR family C-terminal domain-containing protein [Planctomycetes bacterium]|nr:CerR family C-terminal domain-containing protein [Planctomycetota bacterium]